MSIRDGIYGAMFGVAVGDALGAPLEFMSAGAIQQKYGTVRDMLGGGWLNVAPGEVTDDTQMTMLVARGIAIFPVDPIEAIGRRFVKWAKDGPKDIGATCASSISTAISLAKSKDSPTRLDWSMASKKTHYLFSGRSDGNGTLMRTAYVGLYYPDEKQVSKWAYAISRMTHYGTAAAGACVLYSIMLNKLVGIPDLADRIRFAAEYPGTSIYCRNEYRYETLISPRFKPNPSGYVVDSFAAALYCIHTTSSFEEALVKAVNLGGDADTIGAITGGLAGAIYGYSNIPQRWLNALDEGVSMGIKLYCDVALEEGRG